jgi:hypothetical protein
MNMAKKKEEIKATPEGELSGEALAKAAEAESLEATKTEKKKKIQVVRS